MGEGKTQNHQQLWSAYDDRDEKKKDARMTIIEDQDDCGDVDSASSSLVSPIGDDDDSASTISNGSCSSNDDTGDDASSTVTSSSSSNSSGALNDLSDLMAQLPIKRGLSKYYQGKSDSFTCLSMVTSVEDLPKKKSPYRRKNKGSIKCEGGLDPYRLFTLPRPVISKKTSRGSFTSPFRRTNFINTNSTPPQIPSRKS